MANKYYAIRQINGETVGKILTSWDICKAEVNGKRAEYKSFKTQEEAVAYLDGYKEEEKEEDILSNRNNYIYYVDGSYLNDSIGWGFVCVKGDEILSKMCGSVKSVEDETSRNITGELESAKMAIRHAISNDIKKIYIVHDYQGISSYITGAWKPNKEESKQYTEWVNSLKNRIEISFIKIKGHTDNKYNDIVDDLAKLGTYL